MTSRQLLVTLVVFVFAPVVAIAAGAVQRSSQGLLRVLAEIVATLSLSVCFDASVLAVWGAHAARYVELENMFYVMFVVLQPIIPFLCFFHVVRPARLSSKSDPTPF